MRYSLVSILPVKSGPWTSPFETWNFYARRVTAEINRHGNAILSSTVSFNMTREAVATRRLATIVGNRRTYIPLQVKAGSRQSDSMVQSVQSNSFFRQIVVHTESYLAECLSSCATLATPRE